MKSTDRMRQLIKDSHSTTQEVEKPSVTTSANSERMRRLVYGDRVGFDTLDADLKSTSQLLTDTYNNWQTPQQLSDTRKTVEDMNRRLNAYNRYAGIDRSDISDSYKNILANWGDIEATHGAYKTADAFNRSRVFTTLGNDLSNKGLTYDQVKKKRDSYAKGTAEYDFFNEYTGYDDLREYDKALAEMSDGTSKNRVSEARNKYAMEHKADLYRDVMNNSDYAEKSQYNPSESNEVYRYINSEEEKGNIIHKYTMGNLGNYTDPYEQYRYEEMTDEEKGIYNYIYASQGKDKADEFLKDTQISRDKRESDRLDDVVSEVADSGMFGEVYASLLSVPTNLAGGYLSYTNAVGQMITGDVNPYAYGNQYSNMASKAREEVGSNIAERYPDAELFGQNVPQFLYQTGMSIADSTAGAYTMGRGYTPIMGVTAYQQKLKELKEKGIDDNTAKNAALASGIAEAAFEYISLDKLLKAKDIDGIRMLLKETAKQAGIEGSEEVATEISNLITDDLFLGEQSELREYAQSLRDRGYEEKDVNKAIWDKIGSQVGWAGIGGAISGGVMGGVHGGAEYHDTKQTGNAIRGNNRVEDMLDYAYDMPQGSDVFRQYAEYALNGVDESNITDAQLGNLYNKAERSAVSDMNSSEEGRFGMGARAINKLDQIRYTNESTPSDTDHIEIDNGHAVAVTPRGNFTLEDTGLSQNERDILAAAENDHENIDTYNQVMKWYDGTQNIDQMIADYEYAKYLGSLKVGEESLMQNIKSLNATQAMEAYKEGFNSKIEANRNQLKAVAKQWSQNRTIQGNFDDSLIDYSGNSTDPNAVKWSNLTSKQRDGIRFAGLVAEGLGINVKIVGYGEKEGFNGKYIPSTDTLYVDAFAGINKRSLTDTIIPTLSHEMTHWMELKSPELYAKIRESVMDALVKNSSYTAAQLIFEERSRLLNRHPEYRNKSEDELDEIALSEIVARSCEDMLKNSAYAQQIISQLSDEQQNKFVRQIKQIFKNIIGWINDTLKLYDSHSSEAKFLRDYQDEVQKISDAWDAALKDAVEQKKLLNEVGVQYDAETESVAPSQMLSEKTWTESDYVKNRAKAVSIISERLGVSEKKASKYIDDINSIAKMIANAREMLDYDENLDPNSTVLKKNSEYKFSVDISTLCKKRLLTTGIFDAIQQKMKDTVFTSEDLVKLREIMEEEGLEVACGICYVESTRREMGRITQDFIERYKIAEKTGKPITRIKADGEEKLLTKNGKNIYAEKGYIPTLGELNTTDIDRVKVEHPAVYDAYLAFMNARGQAKPKLLETRTAYKGEILRSFKAASAIKARNNAGGLRVQSFSDFEIVHMIDMMQIVMDMSRVGLMSQAYTKVPEFAEIFGNTGMKINLSLIAKGSGLDANGNLIFDDIEGMPADKAFRLREMYSKNVGTILVGKNDEHIRAALADPRIDFVIPFHKSSWKESLYSALGLTGYTDYTDTQNEKPYVPTKKKIKNIQPKEYWNPNKSGKENADAYLELCKKKKVYPKFPQFANEEGYWKLLIDYKMYDNEGKFSPQTVVKPEFNMEAATRILSEYKGGHRSLPTNQTVIDKFVKWYKTERSDTQYSDRDTNIGYHAGDLGKSESLGNQSGGRDTGHFGTGTYFVGNSELLKNYNKRDGKSAPIEKVDFSKYNMFKPSTNSDAKALHKFLGGLNNLRFMSNYPVKSLDEFDEFKDRFSSLSYEFYDNEDDETAINLLGIAQTVLKNSEVISMLMKVHDYGEYRWIGDNGISNDSNDDMPIAKMFDDLSVKEKNKFFDLVQTELDDWRGIESQIEKYEDWYTEDVQKVSNVLGITENKVRSLIDSVYSEINSEYYNNTDSYILDSASTIFMKMLGYEGVDVRHLSDYDNTMYGSVIYDLKDDDLRRKQEIGTARFSDRDTEYMDLAKNPEKNRDKLQQMVEEEAKKNGYTIAASHGTRNGGRFTVFRTNEINSNMGSHFGSRDIADIFANEMDGTNPYVFDTYLKLQNPYVTYDWFGQDDYYPAIEAKHLAEEIGTAEAERLFQEIKDLSEDLAEVLEDEDVLEEGYLTKDQQDVLYGNLRKLLDLGGYDGIEYENGLELVGDTNWIIQHPEQIKSADPVTYDDNGNIIPLSQRFNSSNPDIRYSDRDSEGNKLTKAQQEYFKDSKIRDTDGNLLVMYNGTQSDEFSVFDSDFSADGISFFFTDNLNVARRYANNSEKQYYHETKISIDEMNELIRSTGYNNKVEKNGSKYIINKYRYGEVVGSEFEGTFDEVHDYVMEMYGDNNNGGYFKTYLNIKNPLIIDAKNAWWEFVPFDFGDGRTEGNTRDIAEYAKANGYDGVLINNIIDDDEGKDIFNEAIAFNSSQIKLTENENPTDNLDIRFSDRDETYADVLNQRNHLETQNNNLIEEIKVLKERLALEKKVTNGKVLNNQDILKIARDVKRNAQSTYDAALIGRDLKEAYNYMVTTNDLDANSLFGRFYDIAKKIAGNKKAIIDPYMENVAKDIRSTKIKVDENQLSYLNEMYGKNYRSALRGLISFDENGTSLDTMWQEWSNQYPDLFDYEVTGEDQISKLIDITESLREGRELVQDFADEEETKQIAFDLYNGYWKVNPIVTTADKYEEKIKKINEEHKKNIDNLKKRIDSQKLADDIHYGKVIHNLVEQRNEARKSGKKMLDNYKERQAKNDLIKKITNTAMDLNKKFKQNSRDNHIPEIMRVPVARLLEAIDFSSRQMLDTGRMTNKDMKLSSALADVYIMINEMQANGTLEDGIALPPEYDKDVLLLTKAVQEMEKSTGYVLNDMSLDQLEELHNMIKIFAAGVRNLNKFYKARRFSSISSAANESVKFLESLGKFKERNKLLNSLKTTVEWRGLNPVYGFDKFGTVGKEMFKELQDGWSQFAYNVKEILDYSQSVFNSEQVDAWESEVHEFDILLPTTEAEKQSPDYEPKYQKAYLTTAQIMSAYCLSKRDQARGHFFGGGMEITQINPKKGKPINQTERIQITNTELNDIISRLTPEQISIADKLQDFMNGKCSDWGNYVTMELYGFKGFTEKNYFPIKSSQNSISAENPSDKENSLFRLLNMSFTKALTKNANNPITIDSIFNVYAQHTSDMAKYNALALPVLDVYKWFNYKKRTKVGDDSFEETDNVRVAMDSAYGSDAQHFVRTFLQDLNGVSNVGRDVLGKGFYSRFKAASVGANLRVAALQPTSFYRASDVIDPKYLAAGLLHKPNIDMAKKYCGIAYWKSLGFYDVNIQRGLTDLIKDNQTWMQRATEKSMYLASLGDEMTWGFLWNSCLAEMKEKTNLSGEDLYKATADRLTDVIYRTQVVDSTMTRNEMMRSPDGWDKVKTAFMAEPMLSMSMLTGAINDYAIAKRQGIKGDKVRVARAFGAYVVTNTAAAVVEALFNALREEKKEVDEEYIMQAFLENFAQDMSLIGKIPYLKDIESIFRGYSSSNGELQWADSFVKAYQEAVKMAEGKGSLYKLNKNLVKGFSYLSGVPIFNATRDLQGILNRLGILSPEELQEWFDSLF